MITSRLGKIFFHKLFSKIITMNPLFLNNKALKLIFYDLNPRYPPAPPPPAPLKEIEADLSVQQCRERYIVIHMCEIYTVGTAPNYVKILKFYYNNRTGPQCTVPSLLNLQSSRINTLRYNFFTASQKQSKNAVSLIVSRTHLINSPCHSQRPLHLHVM